MANPPLAYFITFTTYGTWLQGREQGWVDREHNEFGTPIPAGDSDLESKQTDKRRQCEYVLDEPRRRIVLSTIQEVSAHRNWTLWAVHVRTNHVHTVVTAAATPEKVMTDFKAWASRRLREQCAEPADRDRWTQHGSTRYLWTPDSLAEKIKYVLDEQGPRMAFHGHPSLSEPEA